VFSVPHPRLVRHLCDLVFRVANLLCSQSLVWPTSCVGSLLWGRPLMWPTSCVANLLCGQSLVWPISCVANLLCGQSFVQPISCVAKSGGQPHVQMWSPHPRIPNDNNSDFDGAQRGGQSIRHGSHGGGSNSAFLHPSPPGEDNRGAKDKHISHGC